MTARNTARSRTSAGRLGQQTMLPAITERDFQHQIQDLAKTLGWWTYHPYLSIHSPRGWPDLAIVKPPRLILAELKSASGVVSPDQQGVLDLLSQCPGVETYLWRPDDFPGIVRILQGAPR